MAEEIARSRMPGPAVARAPRDAGVSRVAAVRRGGTCSVGRRGPGVSRRRQTQAKDAVIADLATGQPRLQQAVGRASDTTCITSSSSAAAPAGLELVTRLGDKLGKRGKADRHAGRARAHPSVEAAAARGRRRQHGRSTSTSSTIWPRRIGTISATAIGEMIGLDRARQARSGSAPRYDEEGRRDHARARRSPTTRW